MKIWLILILSLSFSSISGQNRQPKELGIGLAIAKNPYSYGNNSYPKDIYTNSKLTEKIHTKKIFPFFYKPDYGLYHFICLEKNNKYYKILINDTEIGFIPNNKKYFFKTWETLLMTASVARIDRKNNPIRKKPNNTEEIITNNCEYETLNVIDIVEQNGEFWIQITYATNCDPYSDDNAKHKTGWIKWRNMKNLLVTFQLLC